MLQKKWLLKEFDKNRVVEMSKEFKISPNEKNRESGGRCPKIF